MRVFVTGATGYVGGAIAARLASAGHDVTGLARSDERARALEAIGVRPHRGDLADAAALLVPLRNCDAVVHAAIPPGDRAAAERALLDVLRVAALDGRVRHVLYTSGVWVHGDTGGTIADETTPLAAPDVVRWRPAHEHMALDLAEHEVHAAVFRPGMVYGGRRGTFGAWFADAARGGSFVYPGDGGQHWSAVHRDDVAEAYRLALEHGRRVTGLDRGAGGERYLLVDDGRATVREMAEAAARATGARAAASGRETIPGADRETHAAMLMDQRFTSARVRRALGWRPAHASFVADAEALYREWRDAEHAPIA
ncbi:MAG: NAD-dependent epimerase/dehydratase family protein [Candidatus Eisenbacteria bacterium]|uniref:NAD-dependent epimerase/dehydratase family protein n=1 Tax=Eiseniibacteriota bacterium TaxID=2212470 RepID=A0A9D6L5P1_UNCEI|nr:NAD-dependent epimerase/dehydratase family protein [Candidatus Eisenbacteria bacterium]MBI3539261.1 NAD-dependent epimerase/dehydratase family protein [Candidatus Eisenbacteria bacterium]